MLFPRRICIAAAIPAIAMAIVTCTDDPKPASPTTDSGAQQGQSGDSVCPDAAPEAGENCVVPEGTTCSFGACGASIAQCTQSRWHLGGNPPTQATCPTAFPSAQDQCPACFPDNFECTYGVCDGPDATTKQSFATCDDAGRWTIETVSCEAGADVQGDAEAGSD